MPGRGGQPWTPRRSRSVAGPVSVSAPAVSRHARTDLRAHQPAAPPHRGQVRDRWVTVSDIYIPRFVWAQISPFIWIRQNRRPGLRAQRLNEMADLVVDVPSIGNGFRDALAQQRLEPASEAMNGGL